ncbi:hypothetical protein RintRC_3296 [Richelia intracellularis]|nr:hypothetical protein RintRC_3296 [Richelia intracellularis]
MGELGVINGVADTAKVPGIGVTTFPIGLDFVNPWELYMVDS